MPLTKNTDHSICGGDRLVLPLLAAAVPFQGSAIGTDPTTGYSRALEAGDKFRGFAVRRVEEAGASNGAVSVEVKAGIFTGRVPLAGILATNVGAKVYMSDDCTFTLTVGTNSLVGTVLGVVAPGIALVRFVTDDIASVSI